MVPERTEVLIVGAGPAGLAAALELKRLGIREVKIIDREPEAGGVPRLCHHTGFGLRDLRRVYSGPSYARHYVRRAETAGIELHLSTTATGWHQPTTLDYSSPRGLGQIEAKAILLATGCRERPRAARLIPGSRPQGVFTTGSLQRFVYEHKLPVGRRAVIVGAELVSLSALMTLAHADVSTAAVVTDLPEPQIYFPYLPVKWLMMDLLQRVPIMPRARVSRIFGQKRVEGLEITRVDSGETIVVDCDTVVFTGDWIPEHELARLGGLTLDSGTRGPRVDALYRTSAEGVFAAGNLLRGAETADMSALEGKQAARHIRDFLNQPAWSERVLPVQVEAPLVWVFPNVISARRERPALGYFAFRCETFYQTSQVCVYQGDRLLHTQAFHRLVPNDSMRLDSSWLEKVNPEGDAIRIGLAR